MKNATFYLLDNDTQQDGLSAVEQLVCEIAAERWRAGKRVLIACENESRLFDWMKPCGQDRQKALFRIIWRAKAPEAARR